MSNELMHHGITGQKWGIRNFQNPDGSLTPEGRLRYRKNPDRVKTSEGKPSLLKSVLIKKKSKSKEDYKVESSKEPLRNNVDDYKKAILNSKNPKAVYNHIDMFTTQELNDFANRLQGEKRVKDLAYPPKVDNWMVKTLKEVGQSEAKTVLKNGSTYLFKEALNKIEFTDPQINKALGDMLFEKKYKKVEVTD